VFPISFFIAFPCGLVAAFLKALIDAEQLQDWATPDGILKESTAWGSVQFLVGFLIVFRTSQAYARFQDGIAYVHQMRAHWYSACASAVSFCKASETTIAKHVVFEHTIIRLVSMLHAVALSEVEDCSSKNDPSQVQAFRYPLLDAAALDLETLEMIRDSDTRVELAYQWILNLLVDNNKCGVLAGVPAPLLATSYQHLEDGMVAFNEAIKVSTIPFPFPYAQTCDWILVLHWVLTPIIVSAWVGNMLWAFIFAFLQVFILWSLNAIAIEIENPFGLDANDIDAEQMQDQFNHSLCLLIHPSAMRTPALQKDLAASLDALATRSGQLLAATGTAKNSIGSVEHDNMWRATSANLRRRQSLQDVWNDMDENQMAVLQGIPLGSKPSLALAAVNERNERSSSSAGSGMLSSSDAGTSRRTSFRRDGTQSPDVEDVVRFQQQRSTSIPSPVNRALYSSEGQNIPHVLNATSGKSQPVRRYNSRERRRRRGSHGNTSSPTKSQYFMGRIISIFGGRTTPEALPESYETVGCDSRSSGVQRARREYSGGRLPSGGSDESVASSQSKSSRSQSKWMPLKTKSQILPPDDNAPTGPQSTRPTQLLGSMEVQQETNSGLARPSVVFVVATHDERGDTSGRPPPEEQGPRLASVAI